MKKIIIEQHYKPNKKFGREREISYLIPLENHGPEWADPSRLNPPDSIYTEIVYKSGERKKMNISSKKFGKKLINNLTN